MAIFLVLQVHLPQNSTLITFASFHYFSDVFLQGCEFSIKLKEYKNASERIAL